MSWLNSKSCALNLAAMMEQRLDAPRGVGPAPIPGAYAAYGQWILRAHGINQTTTVGVQFVFRSNWMVNMPVVYTQASFVRRETDWHCSKDGALCIGLPDEWNDTLKEEYNADSSLARLMDIAVTWSLASTDSLISRHLYAARYGITEWPPDWDQWAHFEAGRAEYRKHQIQKKFRQ